MKNILVSTLIVLSANSLLAQDHSQAEWLEQESEACLTCISPDPLVSSGLKKPRNGVLEASKEIERRALLEGEQELQDEGFERPLELTELEADEKVKGIRDPRIIKTSRGNFKIGSSRKKAVTYSLDF